ncbi:hypothetical protein OLX02_04085 [Novosphingobium sp. KCTC 2891]|nr:hypothetical protein [Novosphingobium sp. KCTC 2891]MCW1381993.1 hypothetical protein [Novosphingobium sp. KCTC 2891]
MVLLFGAAAAALVGRRRFAMQAARTA